MFLLNHHPDHGRSLDQRDEDTLGPDALPAVRRFLAYRHATEPTPLLSLPDLARRLAIGSLFVKDESTRLGLGSFKALGGAFAVLTLVLERAASELCRPANFADLDEPAVRSIAARMTMGCATDGNHGRSVAAGAQMVGARSAIFVHQGVSERRVAAIAKFGAQIIRVAGTYDDAVAEAARVCAEKNWILVSDTSWPGYDRVPRLVMQGYTVMVDEILCAAPSPPTHVFIQAGVGGLAAAVAGHLQARLGRQRPKFIVVEPERAACLLESARAGHERKIAHSEPTVMAMLECYEPSIIAFQVLLRCADAFMSVGEQDAIEAMRTFASAPGNDRPIIAGESGAAGLAGLMCASRDANVRTALGLDASSRVLLVNTEGATDADRYRKLVGRPASNVLAMA